MAGQQELQVQQKREVEKGQEATRPTRAFMPNCRYFRDRRRADGHLREAGGGP